MRQFDYILSVKQFQLYLVKNISLKRRLKSWTPDFSTYTDFPKAIQIYNHYRKHWLGAYWQQHGVYVIPTISWSDKESFSWCFDGEPVGGVVAVSSVGTQVNRDASELFIAGYREMLDRLQPSQIIMYGHVPDECEGNITQVSHFIRQKWAKIEQEQRMKAEND